MVVNVIEPPAQKRRYIKGNKYLTYDELKQVVKPFHFQSLMEYKDYVKTNNMVYRGWPQHPNLYYAEKYNGVEDLLSLPPGTVQANRLIALKKAHEACKGKPRMTRRRVQALKEQTLAQQLDSPIVQQIESTLNMKNVCQFLIEKEMTSTVEHILGENKLTLLDSIEITRGLIEYYNKKISAVK